MPHLHGYQYMVNFFFIYLFIHLFIPQHQLSIFFFFCFVVENHFRATSLWMSMCCASTLLFRPSSKSATHDFSSFSSIHVAYLRRSYCNAYVYAHIHIFVQHKSEQLGTIDFTFSVQWTFLVQTWSGWVRSLLGCLWRSIPSHTYINTHTRTTHLVAHARTI